MNPRELDIKTRKIKPPVSPDFLEHWFAEVKHASRLVMQNEGEHPPTVKYLADDPVMPGGLIEGTIDVSSFFINNQGKQKFAMLAPSLFSDLKAFAVCSVFESYCLLGPELLAEYEGGGYASMGEVPGAREVLLVTLQTRAQNSIEMLEIIRDKSGAVSEVRRDPINNTDDGDVKATGSMTGWVPGSDSEVN